MLEDDLRHAELAVGRLLYDELLQPLVPRGHAQPVNDGPQLLAISHSPNAAAGSTS